jgi:glyoxylase-like metal-dependent hydrolase (beta-lactamase superfamily II)
MSATDPQVPAPRRGRLAALITRGRGTVAPITDRLPEHALLTGGLPKADPPPEMTMFQLPTGTYATRAAFAVRGGAFGDVRQFASTAVLIQHPKGDLLIDAGFGADAAKHIRLLPSFRRAAHRLGQTASDQLDSVGYDRSRLLGVLLTHSHWDHVSGLDSIHVPIFMPASERDYAARAKDDTVFTVVSRGHQIKEYSFDGPEYLGFASSHDFYGDGSVVLVPAAGHTTGSIIAFVTVPSGKRYAFIGDLTWQLDGITRRLQRPLLMRLLADSDAKQIRRDLQRIFAVESRMQIVPAHDTRAYVGIPTLVPASTEQAPEKPGAEL